MAPGSAPWNGGGGELVGVPCVRGSRVYACAHNYCGLGHATCQRQCRFLDLERRRFSKIAILVSSACFAKAVGIAHKLRRCLQCENRDRQTDRLMHRPSTVTLAAHARRGLIS